MAFTNEEKIVVEQFIAAYGRIPGQEGLDFFTNALVDGTMSEDSMREYFMSNKEASIKYPDTMTNEEIVTKVFENALNRAPATQEGLDFFTSKLDDNSTSISDLVGMVLDSARANNGSDKITLDNKIDIADYYLANSSATMPDLSKVDSTLQSVQDIKDSIDAEIIASGGTPVNPDAISGTVSDGYIRGATVFEDLNGNGVLDDGEISAITKADGSFELDANGTASIVAIGGTDISTGLPFENTFTAPSGSTTISPLTTLVDQIIKTSAVDSETAAKQVAASFGLSTDIDILTFDPISAASDDGLQNDAIAVQTAAVQIATILSQSSALLVGAGVAESEADASSAATQALTSIIVNGGELDLTSSTVVQNILLESANNAGASNVQVESIQSVASSVATATANINTVIAQSAQDITDPSELFTQLAQTQVAAEDIENLTAKVVQTGNTEAIEAISNVDAIVTASEDAADEVAEAEAEAAAAIAEEDKADDGSSDDGGGASTPPADTTPPTITAFSADVNGETSGSYKEGTDITITATTSETIKSGDNITVTLDTNDTVRLTASADGTTLEGTYEVSSGDNSNDLTVSSFTIGEVEDTAGNAMTSTALPSSNIADSCDIVVDTTAPTATVTSVAFDETGVLTLGGTNFDTVAAIGEDVKDYLDWSKLSWDIDGDSDTTANISFNLSDIQSAEVITNDRLTIILTSSKAAEIIQTSNYNTNNSSAADTIDITTGFTRDKAGNVASTDGASDLAITITEDTTPPSATPNSDIHISNDEGFSDNDFVTNVPTQTITATLSEELSTGDMVYGSVDGGGSWIDITDKVDGTTISWDGATLAEGDNTIEIKTADAAGNDNTTIATQDYTLDTEVPPGTNFISLSADTGSSNNDGITNSITQAITYQLTAADDLTTTGDKFYCSFDGGTTWAEVANSDLSTTNIAANTNFTWNVTLQEGTHDLILQVRDLAGNSSSSMSLYTYTLDTVAPTSTASLTSVMDDAGSITGPLVSGQTTDDTSLVLSGTLSESLATDETVAIYDGATRLGIATVNATDWTYTDDTLSNGDNVSYTVRVEDVAGNHSTPTQVFTTTIDQTEPTITSPAALSSETSISVTSSESGYASVYASDGTEMATGTPLIANSSGTIVVAAQDSVVSAAIGVSDTAGNQTIGTSVILGTSGDDTSLTGTASDDIIFGFNGADTIYGADGDDRVLGGIGDDTIDGGAGDNTIRGGAGNDHISGGVGDDTFVVLGAIGADEYGIDDVKSDTGAYALGLASLIDTGLAVSDSGVDGADESYDGGAGTNTIEIWGTADLTKATISNVDAFDDHSDLTISAEQLLDLSNANGSSIDLNLLDADSTINITDMTPDMGMSILNAFTTGIDSNDSSLLAGAPTIAFDMYTLSQSTATSYTIKPEDMFDLSNNTTNTLTDASGENSVMTADGTSVTTVNAGDGDDIIVIKTMSSSVTVDGGEGDDILVADSDTSSDLDNVTNVEIVYLTGADTDIKTVDAFNVKTVQQNGVAINAEDITGALNFDGSAETDGFFTITGSDHADTITGGAGNDTIIGGDGADTLTGGDGADIFTYTAESEFGDNITDFHATQGDKIALDIANPAGTASSSTTTEGLFSEAIASSSGGLYYIAKSGKGKVLDIHSVNTNNIALNASQVFTGTFNSADGFKKAITAVTTSHGSPVSFSFVAFGIGTKGTLFQACISRTTKTTNSSSILVNNIKSVHTIATVAGIAATDIVLI